MGHKLFKAFGWDLIGSIISSVSTFITSIFLARILSPEEFGLVAIAMVFILIFNLVGDFGLKQALIQNQDLKEKSYSSVFYLNVTIALVLTSILLVSSSPIAKYYDFPLLKDVIRLLSLTFIFNSLSLVQTAILAKKLDFKSLSIRLIIARVSSCILGIYLALNGYGVFAIVWQEISFSVLNALMLWVLSAWRPLFHFSYLDLKPLLGFGGYLFLRQILHQTINKVDELVIGKVFSASTLGYFGRSNSMSQLINGVTSKSINSFFFPFFSKIQKDKNLFNTTYLSVYKIIIIVSFFITGLAILCSKVIIIGLFGPQWVESVEIFEILMFKLLSFPSSAFLVATLLSQGFSKENFYYGLIKSAFRMIPFIIALIYGFKAFLFSLVIISFLLMIYNNYINSKFLNISFHKQFVPYILNGIPFAIILAFFKYLIFDISLINLKFILIVLSYICIYFLLYFKPVSTVIVKIKNDFKS